MKESVLIALSAIVLCLNGCIEYEEDLALNEDGSGDVRVKYSMKEEVAGMMAMGRYDKKNGEVPVDRFKVNGLFMKKRGLTLSDVNVETKDNRRTVIFNLKFDHFGRLKNTNFFGFKDGIEFRKSKDGTFTYKRRPPAFSEIMGETQQSGGRRKRDEKKEEAARRLKRSQNKAKADQFGYPKASFKLTMPKDITDTNADSHKGRIANWKFEPKFDDSDDNLKDVMEAESKGE